MSKLSKLFSRPVQFLQDSRAFRRLSLKKAQVLRRGSRVTSLELGSIERRSELKARILGEIGKTVPALDLSEGGALRIAVLRQDVHFLGEYLHALVHEGGLTVALRTGNSHLDLAGARLFAIDDFLCRGKVITAAIGVPRGGATITISFEVWKSEAGELVGPKPHAIARRVCERAAEQHGLFRAGKLGCARDLLPAPLITDVEFPVDAVYTWVNHDDPGWRDLWRTVVGAEPHDRGTGSRSLDRFMNRDELKFSLRSLAEFAPWIRHVFVVTNCAAPPWLDAASPKITWVDHAQVIPSDCLPTFSSHAIESRLHHVPGLSDHFIYFNDDVFLMRPTLPRDFFEATGMSKSFLEDYGSVNGEVHPDDPDYLNAARNGRRLIEEAFGRSPTALHKHSPHALRKDVLAEMEERFSEPIARTTRNRFRTPDDVSTVSFLYHHYAYLTSRAVPAPSNALLLKPQTAHYAGKLQQLLEGGSAPISLCLNDGGGSVGFPHWSGHVTEFLEGCFPERSEFER